MVIYHEKEGTEGRITKEYQHCLREYCACADSYVIEFPPGSSVKDKLLICHALELISMAYFEISVPIMPIPKIK